jgi:hypothetical protein
MSCADARSADRHPPLRPEVGEEGFRRLAPSVVTGRDLADDRLGRIGVGSD